jgi:Tfp pilus assembly ATPase PilU
MQRRDDEPNVFLMSEQERASRRARQRRNPAVRVLRAVALAPLRFLAWLYAPQGARPSVGRQMVDGMNRSDANLFELLQHDKVFDAEQKLRQEQHAARLELERQRKEDRDDSG